MTSPDDTQPVRLEDATPPPGPIPISRDALVDVVVEQHMRDLAKLCAQWAGRGRDVAGLVGIVCPCMDCRAKVLPRDEVPRRLAGSEMAAALQRAPSLPGRLTLAVCGEGFCVTRHVCIPRGVDAPDDRGLIVPLTPERRAFLELRATHKGEAIGRQIRKILYGAPFEEIVFMFTPRDGMRRAHRRDRIVDDHWGPVPTQAQVDAAWLDVWPGRALFMLAPEREGQGSQGWSAEWFDPSRLGFTEQEVREAADQCFGRCWHYALTD